MSPEQFEFASKVVASPPTVFIGPDNLGDRTLLYGYDVDRNTWHVFQRDGEMFLHVYNPYAGGTKTYKRGSGLDLTLIVPNKRLYPEMCDFDFCMRLIQQHGIRLPFTNYSGGVEEAQFYGETEITSGKR